MADRDRTSRVPALKPFSAENNGLEEPSDWYCAPAVPCYEPWDSWLKPGTPEHEAARKNVERSRDAFLHVVDAYLTMHRIRPPRGNPIRLPFVRESELELHAFDMRRFDAWMLHRIAQHCLCDGVTPMDLYDVASLWDADTSLPSEYATIARDAGHVIRAGLVVGRFSRAKYDAFFRKIHGVS